MKFFFLPTSIPRGRAWLPESGVDLSAVRRPVGVALAAVLAGVLHGGILFWYLERPVAPPLTMAMALPMIDIALSAPRQSTPQPVEPVKPLVQKEPTPKPVKKAKPKRKPQAKKAPTKLEPIREETQDSSPAPATPPAPVLAQAASPRAETYTPANSHANYLNNPKPVYPLLARRRHWQGLVMLRVFVTVEGHCGKLSVSRSSGHEVLDESALEAVRRWRFVPAKRGEVAQASWVTVPIEFELR